MIQHFLDYIAIERKYSQRTVEAYRDDLRDFCRFLDRTPEEYDPAGVDETDVKEWMLDLLEKQHQSPRSVYRLDTLWRGCPQRVSRLKIA